VSGRTAAGYTGGDTSNPTYEQVCSSKTGHAEAVLVVFDPAAVSYEDLLRVFWESADPTQGMGRGQRYRHPVPLRIFTYSPAQLSAATASRDRYAGGAEEGGARRDHHRDHRRRRLLLRRGLPPAAPGEAPVRRLRSCRDRSPLSRREHRPSSLDRSLGPPPDHGTGVDARAPSRPRGGADGRRGGPPRRSAPPATRSSPTCEDRSRPSGDARNHRRRRRPGQQVVRGVQNIGPPRQAGMPSRSAWTLAETASQAEVDGAVERLGGGPFGARSLLAGSPP